MWGSEVINVGFWTSGLNGGGFSDSRSSCLASGEIAHGTHLNNTCLTGPQSESQGTGEERNFCPFQELKSYSPVRNRIINTFATAHKFGRTVHGFSILDYLLL